MAHTRVTSGLRPPGHFTVHADGGVLGLAARRASAPLTNLSAVTSCRQLLRRCQQTRFMASLLLAGPCGTAALDVAPLVSVQSTVHVSTVTKLVAAVGNQAVGVIVVAAGWYNFTSDMSGAACNVAYVLASALCIGRNLTIQAEVPGSVILNGQKQRRVIYVHEGGTAKLVGLNITGGQTEVSACLSESFMTVHPTPHGSC